MSTNAILKVDGAVKTPLDLTYEDLGRFPEPDQVRDVSRFHPTRPGDGVTLDAILEKAAIEPEAAYATFHADRDDFHVSVPLESLRGQGIVVYRVGNAALPVEKGGPVRLLIRDPLKCQAGELDDCSNIKYLSRIEISSKRGLDTRPSNEEEHEELHAAEAPK
jgi:DMSO/TMAO reductase YedYZ molybdopterin-dependent catalytic subunit